MKHNTSHLEGCTYQAIYVNTQHPRMHERQFEGLSEQNGNMRTSSPNNKFQLKTQESSAKENNALQQSSLQRNNNATHVKITMEIMNYLSTETVTYNTLHYNWTQYSISKHHAVFNIKIIIRKPLSTIHLMCTSAVFWRKILMRHVCHI